MRGEVICDRHDRTARLLHPFVGVIGQGFWRVHRASNDVRGGLAVEDRPYRLLSRGRDLPGVGQMPARLLSGYVAGHVIARLLLAAPAPPPRMPKKNGQPAHCRVPVLVAASPQLQSIINA